MLAFVDPQALDAVLQPLVPDAGERGFVARCLIGEGPLHHRGADCVLMSLLARLAVRSPGPAPPGPGVSVPMRLPPHLAGQVEEGDFPIRMPTRALETLAGGDPSRLEAMIDCLTDGPPQHALANVVLVTLLDQLLHADEG